MIMLVTGLIGGLGLVCLISRRTLLGMMVGIQLLVLGASMIFVLAGIFPSDPLANSARDFRIQGHVVGLFIALGGIAQLVAGYALVIRFFYLKSRIEISELRSLKR